MKLTIIYSSYSDYTSTLSVSFIVRLFLVMKRFQAMAEITLFFMMALFVVDYVTRLEASCGLTLLSVRILADVI